MNDPCTHCICRGDIKQCLNGDCSQRESWIVREMAQLVTDASQFFSVDSFDGDKMKWLDKAKLFTVINRNR